MYQESQPIAKAQMAETSLAQGFASGETLRHALHHYKLHLRQGSLTLDLASDDAAFMTRQMQAWFSALLPAEESASPTLASAPAHAHASVALPPPPVRESLRTERPENVPPTLPPTTLAEAALPPSVGISQAADIPPAVLASLSPLLEEATPALSSASPAALPTFELLPEEEAPSQSPPSAQGPVQLPFETPSLAPAPPVAPSPDAAFDALLDSIFDDLQPIGDDQALPQPLAPVTAPNSQATAAIEPPPVAAAEGLGDTNNLIDSLAALCARTRAQTPEDYLLLCCYYLTFFEAETNFTLKRINSLMVKYGLPLVNHGVLEAMLGAGHLAMVPDLTGMADATEYTLTPQGQSTTEQLF